MSRFSFDTSLGKGLAAIPVREQRETVAAAALRALWRGRYWILLAVALSLMAAFAALALIEKRYAAEAVIKLDLQRPGGATGADQSAVVAFDLSALTQSEARIIRSRSIARAVVLRLGLAEDPRYARDGLSAAALQATMMRHLTRTSDAGLAWLGVAKPDREAESASPPDDSVIPAQESSAEGRAVRDLVRRLTVAADNRSYLLTIAYHGYEPGLAARVVDAVAEEYLARQSEAAFTPVRQRAEWLAARVAEATSALAAADADVAAFRVKTGVLGSALEAPIDPENVARQQLLDVTAQLSAATLARMAEERRLARVQEMLQLNQVPSANDLQGSPLIAQLVEREAAAVRELREQQERFGPRHPTVLESQAGITDLRRRLRSELTRTVAVISSDFAAARSSEANLERRLAELRKAVIGSKAHEAELRQLLNTVQTLRDRVASLTRSYDQALAARDLRPVTASLILPAEADRSPVAPRPLLIVGLALLTGLGTSMSGVLLLERRDHGFRTSGDLRTELDARCLSMIPELSSPACRARPPGQLWPSGNAAFDEAVYAVGASVGLFNGAQPCRTVLVTSAVAGEGKSTLCLALAQAMTAVNKRVLLIEGMPLRDTERPMPEAEGASVSDMVPVPGSRNGMLVILPWDNNPASPTASAKSDKLHQALDEARKHFDLILIEGAPVMLVADSLVLGRQADVVVHVVRWAHTKRRVVDAALSRLRENSVRVDGLVLARVDLRRHRRLGLLDECSFYLRERRFYERMAGRARPHSFASGKGSGVPPKGYRT